MGLSRKAGRDLAQQKGICLRWVVPTGVCGRTLSGGACPKHGGDVFSAQSAQTLTPDGR